MRERKRQRDEETAVSFTLQPKRKSRSNKKVSQPPFYSLGGKKQQKWRVGGTVNIRRGDGVTENIRSGEGGKEKKKN